MTAIAQIRPAVAAPRARHLRPWLEEVHSAWMQEVLAVIDAARATDAGIWVRWGAVRYIDSTFAERIRVARAAMARLRPHYPDDTASRLWAVGELLDQLRSHLDRMVSLHQNGEEFSAEAVKFLRALGCWCREVEQALGSLEWQELSPQAQADVVRLAGEGQKIGA